jgi:hypothetical protein
VILFDSVSDSKRKIDERKEDFASFFDKKCWKDLKSSYLSLPRKKPKQIQDWQVEGSLVGTASIDIPSALLAILS